jgi:signal transduction histidine kinase/CheY-like chemotaxis protein
MDNKVKTAAWKHRKVHEYYFWAMAVSWTLLLLFSFFWTRHNATEQVMELVRVQARTAYDKDVLYRFWNSTHGSVYVPVSDTTPPNPYLEVPERDIVTPQGVPLTLMNPAYMTRQANEIGFDRLGIYGHLTSLKPLRPGNAPDTWERQGLIEFESGVTEVSSVEQMGDKQVLRLMRPLLVEEACLPCHAKQQYQVGEIRGGISVSINMAPSMALLASSHFRLAAGHLLLWLTGLAGLLVRSRMLIKRDQERRELAEQLQENNNFLEQRVVERTAELKESNRLLQKDIEERIAAEQEKEQLASQLRHAQKMELIGTLSGGIAHDFNNLLTPILGYAELALQRPELTDRLAKDLQQINAAAERGKGLVHQILSFSRSSGQNRVAISMQQMVREVLDLIRPTFPKSINIDIQMPADDLMVEADPVQIHQVVMNLCTNAWHAMQGQEGTLKLTLERLQATRAKLAVKEQFASEYVCLKVYDSGCGIDQQTREKIFDPFFTTKKDGKGTGLGLSVVHGIIHSHGGAIGVESSVGQGSCFQVFLPLVVADRLPSEVAPVPQGKGQHILLVDDEHEIVEMLSEGLSRYGFKVSGYCHGQDALDQFQIQPEAYDLLLSDRLMPDLSGQQLVAAVRKIRPELPVLFMTGYDDRDSEHGDQSLDKIRYLLKPITTREVAEHIILQLSGF